MILQSVINDCEPEGKLDKDGERDKMILRMIMMRKG